jgi:hypothetical protein
MRGGPAARRRRPRHPARLAIARIACATSSCDSGRVDLTPAGCEGFEGAVHRSSVAECDARRCRRRRLERTAQTLSWGAAKSRRSAVPLPARIGAVKLNGWRRHVYDRVGREKPTPAATSSCRGSATLAGARSKSSRSTTSPTVASCRRCAAIVANAACVLTTCSRSSQVSRSRSSRRSGCTGCRATAYSRACAMPRF